MIYVAYSWLVVTKRIIDLHNIGTFLPFFYNIPFASFLPLPRTSLLELPVTLFTNVPRIENVKSSPGQNFCCESKPTVFLRHGDKSRQSGPGLSAHLTGCVALELSWVGSLRSRW